MRLGYIVCWSFCAFLTLDVSAETAEPFFTHWAKHPYSSASMKRDELGLVLATIRTQRPDGVITRTAEVIPLDHIISLNPTGLTYLELKGEMKVLPFPELPASIIEATGWTPAILEQYKNPAPPPAAVTSSEPQQQRRRTVGEVIDEYARKEYPTDYNMQEAIRRWSLEAYMKLKKLEEEGADGVPSEVLRGIIDRAYEEWRGNYRMIYFEADKQVKAYQRLNR